MFVRTAAQLGVAGISLAHCPAATDDVVRQGLASAPMLALLDLTDTPLTDAAMPAIAALPALAHVWLAGTTVGMCKRGHLCERGRR